MPSSTCSAAASSASSVSSSSPSYSSVLKSKPGSISSSQTSITRSSSTSSLSSLSSLTSCGSSSSSSSFSPKSFLTVHDLYMRYAPLASLTKSTIPQVSLPRVLPPMTLQDLLNKFAPKLSATTPEPSSSAKTANPPAPQPSPQIPTPSLQEMIDKLSAATPQKKAPAKTRVSKVDKQGRDVTKAGMKSTADKPSPTYRRWCTFSPRWRHRYLTPLGLAQVGYKHTPSSDMDMITCDTCQSQWCTWNQTLTIVSIQSMHEKSCSFWKEDPDDKWV